MALKSSPSLRQALAQGHAPKKYEADGFKLAAHTTVHYKSADLFGKALREQKEATVFRSAAGVQGLTEEGYIAGTDLRLTEGAFADLCHATNTPVGFAKALGKRNPRLALEVVSEMTSSMFCGDDMLLVVDERDNLVANIVPKNGYSPTPTADILDWTLSTGDYNLTNGWLCGPHSRFTVVSPDTSFQPVKGDVVRDGVSVNNELHNRVEIGSYFERLVCTNGMTARDEMGSRRISHQGTKDDLHIAIQAALVTVTANADLVREATRLAASRLLLPAEVRNLRNWIGISANGGSPKLDTAVRDKAQQEAKDEGRAEHEVTLWNFVNGINFQAHSASGLNRRVSLETMAHNALLKFSADFNN